MIDTNHLCPGCMEHWEDPEKPCPHCGFTWDEEQDSRAQHIFTILGGRYLLGRKIGSGGFGITYIAMDLMEEKKTAIKEFFPFSLSEREGEDVVPFPGEEGRDFRKALRSFRKEGELLSRVRSIEGIVNYRDFLDEYGTSYLVMEYVEGQNLKQYMRQSEKPFSQEEALRLMRPILLAVDQLHKMNILHRDISPENLILKPDGTLTLVDLGAAREYSLDEDENLTVILKHGYAPEEQYHHGSRQGPWTDLYACCAVLYQMVSGILPQNAAARDKWDDLVPLDELEGVDVTKPFARAIEKGMSIDASLRYADIPQLLADLYPPKPEPIPEKKQEPDSNAESESKSEHKSETEPKPKSEPEFESRQKTDPESRAKTESEPKTEPGSKAKSESQSTAKTGSQSAPKTGSSPQQKSTAKPTIRKRRWMWLVIPELALALILLYFAYMSGHTRLEDYTGWEINNAVSIAQDTLTVTQVGEIVTDSDEYGLVMVQSPSAGNIVRNGSEITLTWGVPDFEGMSWSKACDLAEELGIEITKSSYKVSSSNVGTISYATYDDSGKAVSVTVVKPDFKGMSWLDACDLAEEQGITIGEPTYTESSEETGTILSAKYSNFGNTVSVTVAIPSLTGMDVESAQSQLETAFGKVEVKETTEYSDSVEKGKIIDYDLDSDLSSDGGSLYLSLTVSKGPEYVTVPDLEGMTPEEAKEALEAVGLVYAECNYTVYSPYEAGCVALLYQYEAGDTVKQGTAIWAVLSTAKISHSGLISSNKSEITLTRGGGSVSIKLTTSSSIRAGQYMGTYDYDFSSNWVDTSWTLTVSADENAVSGWIQVRVWKSTSERENGDAPVDYINIRVNIEDS